MYTAAFLYSGLLSPSYLPHLFIRCSLYLTGMISMIIAKNEFGENKPGVTFVMTMIGLTLQESVFYRV